MPQINKSNILNDLIPRPAQIEPAGDKLSLDDLNLILIPAELRQHGAALIKAFQYFGKHLQIAGGEDSDIALNLDRTLAAEGWEIEIGRKKIRIRGGSPAGLFYAVSAMGQILALVFARGSENVFFDCGTIRDNPRCEWRGLMLDSVRHFQSKEKIKEVIRLIADWRLNVFHWHLSDSQGLRIPSALVSAPDCNCYTREDLKEIADFAAEHFVRIVPELDMPGHSAWILRRFPQYACDPARPGAEFCLGNPEAKEFLKSLLAEVMEFFPDSPIIHLGGDEADTSNWDSCPNCRAALKNAGLSRIRELENQFANEMTRYVISCGRRPMVWCTDSIHPADTIVQAWQSVNEIHRTYPHGNQIVNSVHYCCYFDYPANSADPRKSWMPTLTEETVYQSIEPFPPKTPGILLGAEACLWTEIVPEWRVTSKIESRLAAFAENAWCCYEDKDWNDFQRRKMRLEAAGHRDFLRR